MTETTADAVVAIFEKGNATRGDWEQAKRQAFAERSELAAFEAKARELQEAWEKSRAKDETVALAYGAACWLLDRWQDALAPLEAASGSVDAVLLGDCLLGLGRFEEAAKAYRRVRAKDEDGLAAAVRAIEALCLAGNVKPAGEILETWREAGEEHADWLYARGCVLAHSGQYEEALDALEAACKKDPDHVRAWFRLGYWSELRGLDERAVESYEECAGLSPCPASALVNLGILYEDSGRCEKAVAVYQRVLKRDPTNARVRLYLKDALGSVEQFYDEDTRRRYDRASALLSTPVSEFELSVRSRNCLARMDVRNLGDLVQLTEEDLLGFKNFGETSLREIKEMLRARGLRFGMRVTGEAPPASDAIQTETPAQQDLLGRPVGELELSIRSRRALESMGVKSVGELCRLSEPELLQCRNFGQTSLNEIRQKLSELSLSLREDEG